MTKRVTISMIVATLRRRVSQETLEQLIEELEDAAAEMEMNAEADDQHDDDRLDISVVDALLDEMSWIRP